MPQQGQPAELVVLRGHRDRVRDALPGRLDVDGPAGHVHGAAAPRHGLGHLTRVYGTRPVEPAERAAWLEARTAAGYPVLGVAVARRAAHELELDSGIASTSVAALLADLGYNGLVVGADGRFFCGLPGAPRYGCDEIGH